MAEARRFVCGTCGREIVAWSDGNPYYIDELGEKQYAYHPNFDGLSKCIGNDSPHLCLACGKEVMVDSRAPATECPKCTAAKLVDTFELDGRPCPYCDKGTFAADPNPCAIS